MVAPYPGLRPFEPHESETFFGREDHTDRLLEILQRERFLAVIGPSGCGKSSLVRAGLLPGLASGALGTGSDWRLALFRPGSQPLLAMAQALLGAHALGRELLGEALPHADAEEISAEAALLAAELRRGAQGLGDLLDTAAARRAEGLAPFNLLVLVDQFEEVFTYAGAAGVASDESGAFVDLLLAARAEAASRVHVALTMRTDFLGNCVRFLELPEAINRAQYLTPRLGPTEMARAIVGPARVFGGDVDSGLVEELIRKVGNDSDQLPILQHALARMWRVAEKKTPGAPLIDGDCAEAVSMASSALNRHAEDVFASLGNEQQALVEMLFRALTERRESGGQEVRRPQSLAAVAAWAGVAADDLKPLIEAYAAPEVSFLHYGRELTGKSVVDLTHEALIRQWDRLRQWVASEFQRGQAYRRYSQRAAEYVNSGDLLKGGELTRALDWWNPSVECGVHPPQLAEDTIQALSSGANPPGADLVAHRASVALGAGLPGNIGLGEGNPTGVEPCARPHPNLPPSGEGVEMPGGGLHTQGSPIGADSEKPNATWQPSPHWAQRYSNAQGDALAEEFERTRRYIIDSRDEERRLREAEQRQLEEQAEAERRRADHERQLADEARMSARRARRLAAIVAVVALFALGLAYVAYTFQQRAQTAQRQAQTAQHQAQTAQHQAQTAQHQAQTAQQRRTLSLFESQLTHSSLLARVEDYAEAWRVLAESARLDADIPETRRHARNLLAGFVETMGGQAEQVYVGTGAALSGGVTVSPDGKLLAAAGERGTLVLFDADSGKLLKRLEGHDSKAGQFGSVRSMAFAPLDRWLFSGGEDSRIISWSLPAGEKLGEWKAPDAVIALALSPDGETLASGSPDGQIILWDVAGGKTIRTLKGHTKRIAGSSKGLAFSADGQWLASASWDKTARIWDAKTGKNLHVLDWHNEPVMAVAFSPDNELLATSSYDKRVVLWKAQTGERVRVLVGHTNIVFGVAFSADGRHLYSASRDNTLRQWDVASGITRRVYQGHEAALWSVALHGDRLYTAANDATVRRWSSATPEQWVWDMSEEPDSVAISPDVNLITAGFKSGTLRLYNRAAGQELARIDNAHSSPIYSVTFDPTGTQIATASFYDKTVKIWRLERTDIGLRLIPVNTLQGHTKGVYMVAFSPDGRRLATAGYDEQIGLFEVADGKGRLFPAHEAPVGSVAFNPQGDRLLSAGEDGRLRLWNLDDPSQPPLEIAQTQDKLLWASLSPDGREVAAVGRDQTVFLYDFPKTDVPRRLVGHEQTVVRAIYSPDGRQLATVSWDMTVRLWDVDSQRLLFTMRLPTEIQDPRPLWDFDFRCAAGDCWIAVPLTMGRLVLYRLPYEHPPAALVPPARSSGG